MGTLECPSSNNTAFFFSNLQKCVSVVAQAPVVLTLRAAACCPRLTSDPLTIPVCSSQKVTHGPPNKLGHRMGTSYCAKRSDHPPSPLKKGICPHFHHTRHFQRRTSKALHFWKGSSRWNDKRHWMSLGFFFFFKLEKKKIN